MKQKIILLVLVISIIFGSIGFTTFPTADDNIVEDEEPSSTTSIITTTITSTTSTTVITTTTTTVKEKYPIAKSVWDIMKSYGWNDIICAGIMGNMMRECGGDSFNLQWNIIGGKSHYGLCQWSYKYHRGAWKKDIIGQLEYLKDTLQLSIFDNCKTPEEAAYVFCKKYEKPAASDPIYKRKDNALRAYQYFSGN